LGIKLLPAIFELGNEDIKYVGHVEIEQLNNMMMRGIKLRSKWKLEEWPNWNEKSISRTIWDENNMNEGILRNTYKKSKRVCVRPLNIFTVST
jgi:hypothetical protein